MPESSSPTVFSTMTAVVLSLICGLVLPNASEAQETDLDYRSFDCAGFMRRDGNLLELGERVSGEWVFRDFSCVARSCVHHRREETEGGVESDIFHQIYFLGESLRYVSTRSIWGPESNTPTSHKTLTVNPNSCFTRVPDEDLWKLDTGTIRYENGEVHAEPRSGDYRVDYFYAPMRLLGDWSNVATITFEKKSSGGLRYLPAYLEDIYGDVVLRSGSMRASYEIPAHHTGEWRVFEVPVDGPGWRLKGGATSVADILTNVTGFQIRAQYGPGKNTSAIRNVAIKPR